MKKAILSALLAPEDVTGPSGATTHARPVERLASVVADRRRSQLCRPVRASSCSRQLRRPASRAGESRGRRMQACATPCTPYRTMVGAAIAAERPVRDRDVAREAARPRRSPRSTVECVTAFLTQRRTATAVQVGQQPLTRQHGGGHHLLPRVVHDRQRGACDSKRDEEIESQVGAGQADHVRHELDECLSESRPR